MWLELSILTIIATFFFIIFCVNPYSTSILGKIRHFFFRRFPSILERCGEKILGRYIVGAIKAAFAYVFLRKNPIVMIVYVGITYGGIAVFLLRGVVPFLPSEQIGPVHILFCCILMISSLASFLFLVSTDPGKITRNSIKLLQKKYPYDNFLFKPTECPTCKLTKIARSKHCSLCNTCIERQDHHCIWINGCIGAKNYCYFLWFLASHAVMCIDIAFITSFVYVRIVEVYGLFSNYYYSEITKRVMTPRPGLVLQYLIRNYPDLFFVLVLCGCMSIALPLFLMYHLSLLFQNQTSNESRKTSQMKLKWTRELYEKRIDLKGADGEVRSKLQQEVKELEGNIKELEKDFYDKGVRQNVMEVLFSHCLPV
eukprot:TRINITY_DN9512_c0_g1_i6.p1 TRINITY_DN9512_c0_g1~~TRINITY_DN9512_c0_g1_i6.p1  ORF type:complete len:369 (-),score=36.10 TRINITY_DN9512_c0_g1_i6:102-1208(-)